MTGTTVRNSSVLNPVAEGTVELAVFKLSAT